LFLTLCKKKFILIKEVFPYTIFNLLSCFYKRLNYQLHELLDDYGESFSKNPQYTLDFIKNKRQELESLKMFDDPDDFKKYIAIIGRYIEALVKSGKYNLAIDEANAMMPLIEESRAKLAIKASEITWYLTIRFQKALAHFQLKDYMVALKEFKELKTVDPHSDEIKKWVVYARYGKFKQYEIFIIVAASILIFGGLFFRRYFPPAVNIIASITGLALITICWIMNYKIKKNRRIKR